MEREKLRRWSKHSFALFLTAMAAFTILSRAMASLTVPVVSTGFCKNGSVNYEITGEGTFSLTDLTYIPAEPGLRIESVSAVLGQKVREGETLFTYRMEDILKKQKELMRKLEKADLSLKQLELKNHSVPGLSEEELALQNLEAAKRALEFGQQDLEQIKTGCEEKLERLKRDFNENMSQSEEEMEEETRRQYRSAERAYDLAVSRRDSTVKRAEREVDDLEEEYARLEEEGASETELAKAEKKLLRAREDLELVKEEQQMAVDEAKAAFRAAEEDYGNVSSGRRTAAETLKNSYEASAQAVEAQIQAGERNVRELEEALTMAEQAVANARVRDAGTRAEKELEVQSNHLEIRKAQLDKQETEEELARIDALAKNGGIVAAGKDGIVAEIEVEAGKTAAGEEIVSVGDGSLLFQGTIDKKMAQMIQSGTPLTLKYGDTDRPWKAAVETIDFLTEGEEARFTARTETEIGAVGAFAPYTISLQSEQYDRVVPVNALRQGNQGYYILVVKTEKTILGEELTAVEVPVEVLEKSSTSAALSGAFGSEDKIITGSSKMISAGDRVRLSDE